MAAAKHEATHSKEQSAVSLFSGWAQQGVQTFFAMQRILLDLAMRQNANVMHVLREQLSHPNHSPATIFGEVAGTGMNSFFEGQKVLLDLGKQQNEILMNGVKERVGDCPRRHAAIDLLRRSVDTFIHMQQEFLKIASKQNHAWVEAAKTGKPYQPEHAVDLARESMETFVKAQKQFLDVIADETAKATGAKRTDSVKKMKKTELSEISRKAAESFIDIQKKLVDVAGEQMNANTKTAGKAFELLRPFPLLPLAERTREGVKSYVDAQRELMDVIAKPSNGHQHSKTAPRHAKRPVRTARKAPEATATA